MRETKPPSLLDRLILLHGEGGPASLFAPELVAYDISVSFGLSLCVVRLGGGRGVHVAMYGITAWIVN